MFRVLSVFRKEERVIAGECTRFGNLVHSFEMVAQKCGA
jgi:hypothetical protein